MKSFLAKFFLASILLALLASCSPQKSAPMNMDKSPITSACSLPEPESNIRHWEAFRNQNVNAMIAAFDPKSPNVPSVSDAQAYFVSVKSTETIFDAIVWVATCPTSDGSTYSFFIVNEHNATKSITQWYVVTTSHEGLLEKVE